MKESRVLEIAEVTGISKWTVHEMMSVLNLCKISAHWVLKMLTEEHKSKECPSGTEAFAVTKKKEYHYKRKKTWV
jgi:hypothetical protein